jgi:HEAT repeat protein
MQDRLCIRITLILLSVCALVTVAVFAIRHKEPSFEGRYLSDWIWTMNGSEPGPDKDKARAVVRQLGTNSIPLLLRWLRQEDRPSLTGRFDKLRHDLFFWLVRHKLIANRSIRSLRDFNPSRSAMAMWALPELDHTGRVTAIPTLIQMLGEKNRWPENIPRAAGGACIVLSKMAPESTAPLTEALSSHDPQVWALAAGALGEIGPNARAAIPVLAKRLTDKDPLMRVGAAGVIGKIGGDPNVFLPVVIQSLTQVDPINVDSPLEILLRYKERARAAVPVLIRILDKNPSSPNPTNTIVRDQVINALRQIDPEALTKAGAP